MCRAELDIDMLTSLRSVIAVIQSSHTHDPACAGHCAQQWVKSPVPPFF